MSSSKHDKQETSDDEGGPPQDVRSRIAAFELNGTAGAASSNTKPKPTSAAVSIASRTAVPYGNYDPLQASASPSKTDEPLIIRPSQRSREPSMSATGIRPSSGAGTRVALPGLGGRTASSSSSSSMIPPSSSSVAGNKTASSLSQSRAWPPVRPPSSPADVSSAISKAMDDSALTRSSDQPMNSLHKTSIDSQDLPQNKTSAAATLPTPQLPARKNSNTSTTSASTSFSTFTNASTLTSEPLDLPSRMLPPLPGGKPTVMSASVPTTAVSNVPKLPPRRQDTKSSTLSTDSLQRPPQRESSTSTSTTPGTTGSSQSQGSSSISAVSVPVSNRPLRSSTMQSDSSNRSGAPSLASLPPRPREQSTPLRSLPPPPPRNLPASGDLGPAASSQSSISNGSQRALSTVAPVKRYEDLWEKLAQSFGLQSRLSSSLENARLDGVVVLQVWRMSKLSDSILGRIWSVANDIKSPSETCELTSSCT